MKNFLLITVIFLTSCTTKPVKNNFDFSNEINFDKFRNMLQEYAKSNPYPNIDN